MTVASPDAMDWRVVRRCVLLVAALQFFVVLEGSILLPIGPVLSAELRFPPHELGYLNSTFLFAAAIAGLAGSLLLDRYDRRTVLCVALTGLAVSTALAAAAQSLGGLMLCRAVAGLCGGPAAAVGLAIVGDVAPAATRGRAMGVVAAGSGLSLIIGIPLALVLADAIGWRTMFLSIAAFGAVLIVTARIAFPAGLGRRGGGTAREAFAQFGAMLRSRTNLMLLAMTGLVFSTVHLLAADLAPFLVYNLGSPSGDLKFIWMIGGAVGLCGSQLTSYLADRFGPVRVFHGASVLAIATTYLLFVQQPVVLPNTVLFAAYLVSVNARIVLAQTMSSLVSEPATRGRFMSLAGASNQASSGLLLVAGSEVLQTAGSGALVHMDVLGWAGIATAVAAGWLATRLATRLERAMPRRDRPSAAAR